jgi:hypothetical protein
MDEAMITLDSTGRVGGVDTRVDAPSLHPLTLPSSLTLCVLIMCRDIEWLDALRVLRRGSKLLRQVQRRSWVRCTLNSRGRYCSA